MGLCASKPGVKEPASLASQYAADTGPAVTGQKAECQENKSQADTDGLAGTACATGGDAVVDASSPWRPSQGIEPTGSSTSPAAEGPGREVPSSSSAPSGALSGTGHTIGNGQQQQQQPVAPLSASVRRTSAQPGLQQQESPGQLQQAGSLPPYSSDVANLNAESSTRSAGALQPTGFQFMPPAQVAREVAQLSWVGHGGYGAVYKGVWQGANVAVKFTVTEYCDLQGASAHEAVLSKILSHPNVVQTFASRVALLDEDFLRSVFDGEVNFPSRELPVDSFRSGEGFGSPYGANTSMKFKDVLTHIGARPGHYITQMIMEYCDRGSLHQAIAKGLFKSSSKWNNKIALRALLRTAREIAQGMSHLHSCRIVHGDLKPGNVLLMSSRADRRGFTAKVSDFGLSTYCMASHISVTRWSTVSYMAPEAFEGHLAMASDVYSFGVMLWEMYTGQQPYAGMQAAQIVMGVQAGHLTLEWPPESDPRIMELIDACIQREAVQRPSFLQLINMLTALEAHIRIEASQNSEVSDVRVQLLQAPSGASALSVTAAAAAAASAAAAAAAAAMPGLSPPQAAEDGGLTDERAEDERRLSLEPEPEAIMGLKPPPLPSEG